MANTELMQKSQSEPVLPIVLPLTAERLIHVLRKDNCQPSLFEITFGPDALEMLSDDREVLRSITSVTRLHGVEVQFPERPGYQPSCLEVRLIGGDRYVQAGIHATVLLTSWRA